MQRGEDIESSSYSRGLKEPILLEQKSIELEERKQISFSPVELPKADTSALYEKTVLNFKFFYTCFLFLAISTIFGPFSRFIYKYFQNGLIIARNIEIIDDEGTHQQKITWFLRIFTTVTTFIYKFNTVQLYVLLYTEISLIVCYSAFYSVKKPSEVQAMQERRIARKDDQDEHNIVRRYFIEAQKSQSKFFDRENLKIDFKEVDFDAFAFYTIECPTGYAAWRPSVMPSASGPRGTAIFFTKDPNKNVFKIDGVGYTEKILRKCEYDIERFNYNTKIARVASRLIVVLRFLAPFVWDIFNTKPLEYVATVSEFIYLFQTVFYLYLIYRSAYVYDILFYGIVIYIQKWRVLYLLQAFLYHEHEKVKDQFPNPHFIIPENIMSWYYMRKLCNTVYAEFYIIVNVVLSYMLIYLVLAFLEVFWDVFNLGNLNVFNDTSSQRAFDAITGSFTLVLLIILMISIILIVEINRFHDTNVSMLEKQVYTFRVLRVHRQEYTKFLASEVSSDANSIEFRSWDQNRRILQVFKQVYGQQYCVEEYDRHMKTVIRTIEAIMADLKEEFRMYPHTLLGLRVDYVLLFRLGSAFSVIGFGKIKQLLRL